VATNYNRPDKGFEGGVALFKDPDGWLTGEAVIKFVDKETCLAAMAKFNGKMLGRWRIVLDVSTIHKFAGDESL